MIIQIKDWKFDVDLDSTMAYSGQAVQEHCTCGYCRNFYAAVDTAYPNLRQFLSKFGVHIEAPDELIPYEPTIMEAGYAVCGRVVHAGYKPIMIDGLSIGITNSEALRSKICCPDPFFVLNTGLMELPWVLEEKMEDVISPANEPDYLDEITMRLLKDYPQDYIQ